MKLAFALPLAAVLAAGITACGASGHKAAASHTAAMSSSAAPTQAAAAGPSPCSAAVSTWDAISLAGIPAPASPVNSLAQAMLSLRNATSAGKTALFSVLGKRIAKDALAVLHRDLPPRCAPGLRLAVRRQMTFAGIAGVGLELGNTSTAASAFKAATVYQKRAMAREDGITGSDWGGW
jgi:hypothetical protein